MEFFAPTTVAEAVGLLQRYGSGAKLLAGGTDLVIELKEGKVKPDAVISLGEVSGLRDIAREDAWLVLGALVNHAQLQTSSLVAECAPMLVEAAAEFAAPAVREMATIAGNLVTASPGADTALALLALGAEVELVGPSGRRRLPLTEFFVGPHRAALRPDEILTSVRVPISPSPAAACFIKLGTRKALAVSVIGVGASLDLIDGVCRQARIALGAVAPTPRRSAAAEAVLVGQRPTPELIAAAADKIGEEIPERKGRRASSWYRRRVAPVLVRRALTAAVERS